MKLQLFASSSHNTYGSSTSSHSHTEGGSHTYTVADSQSHSQGGANSSAIGKSYLSGEIEDNTAAYRNKYNIAAEENANVQNAYQNLQTALDAKPTFQSQYESKLSDMYNQIMGMDKFKYDFNADQMYQMYKDQYQNAGKRAMQDTLGQASQLTGGYNSSYAQSAAQQTYQNYLQSLNNMIPELRNQAYQEYQADKDDMYNKFNLTNSMYQDEYGRYRDTVQDWQSDRAFNYNAYQDERNAFQNERNYWNQEYWKEREAEQTQTEDTASTNWNDTTSHSESNSWTDYWEDTTSSSSTSGWSNTYNMDASDYASMLQAQYGNNYIGSGNTAAKRAQESLAAATEGKYKTSADINGTAEWSDRTPKDTWSQLYSSNYNLSKSITGNTADTTAIQKFLASAKDIKEINEVIDDLKKNGYNGNTYSQQDLAWLKEWAQKHL